MPFFQRWLPARNGRLGTVNDGDKTFFHSEHSFRCISAQLSGWADFSPIDSLVFHSDVTTWIVCYRAFSAGSLHSGKHGWEACAGAPPKEDPPTHRASCPQNWVLIPSIPPCSSPLLATWPQPQNWILITSPPFSTSWIKTIISLKQMLIIYIPSYELRGISLLCHIFF